MNTKKHRSRLITCFLSVCLFIAMTGCTKNETLPSEIDAPPNEIISEEPAENGDLTVDASIPDEETAPKMYESYTEAYLDLLIANRSVLTNEQLDVRLIAMGMDIGDGKIAVFDVFGDEAPELLYIYMDTDGSPQLFFKVLTYSKTEGVETIFDSRVHSVAGGDHNYCIYLSHSGELTGYFFESGVDGYYGFWPVFPMDDPAYTGYQEPYLSYDNRDFAKLYCGTAEGGTEFYMQDGKKIADAQFDKIGKELIGDITKVIFQGPLIPEHGLGLYKYNFWKDIKPFEEDCMTYAEVVTWLKTQIDNQ